ncbi:MAG TPA: (2Fe-2S) ferredoxin domain-containing protein [Williamwhitmania sp.]|jgi:NADH:ubiquinone oxidoreductase subunit E|nr:(2Fe-2S) ferredoxin domain-containing protein [Williamwhitmania sp.]
MSNIENNVEIVICLGSSCFSRGNKAIMQEINGYLEAKGLKNSAFFHGGHCFGNCSDGPIIKVNDIEYRQVTPSMVQEILNKAFGIKQ